MSAEGPNRAELSEREHEILRLVATGASNKQIAQQLDISPNTVKVHLRNIFGKIGVATRTEATLYAIRAGLAVVPRAATTAAETPQALEPDTPEAPNAPQAPAPNGGQAAAVSVTPPAAGSSGWRAWRFAAGLGVIVIVLLLAELWANRQPGATPAASTPAVTHAPLPTPVRWVVKAPLPTARSGLAAAVYDNMVYTIAGETAKGITGLVERYNPSGDQWATLTAKPVAVRDVGAAVIGGLIYVPGGRLPSGQVTNQFEAYDPRSDKWTERAPLPVALSGYALATYEGKLYLFGGWDGASAVAKTFEYSPDTDHWVEKTPMPTARGFAGAAVAGSRIFVIGGEAGQKPSGVNEAYTPEQDTPNSNPWQTFPPLPAERSHMAVASVADIIYVFGGENNDQPLSFDERSGAWSHEPAPASPLAAEAGLAVLGSQIELLGGKLASQPSSNHVGYQAIYVILLPVAAP